MFRLVQFGKRTALAEASAGATRDAVLNLEGRIRDTLRTIYDPEIPVNIHDLGLIYDIDIGPDAEVRIRMTLTAPACPVAGTLPGQVETRVKGVDGVADCRVDLVWDPPWTMERMTDEAKLQLGLL